MIAIGVGCRRGCMGAEIAALVRDALATLPAGLAPGGLFSIAAKHDETGIHAAAAMLDLPLTFLHRAALLNVADGALTHSLHAKALFGLPSIAETAALAGAGEGAIILVPRRASARATCAVASSAKQKDDTPRRLNDQSQIR